MTTSPPTVVVTGASGYLGSRIADTLESRGRRVVRLLRSPSKGQADAFSYDLSTPLSREVIDALHSADALVHTAYDLSLTSATDIWRVNVEGTRRLLDSATQAGVG